MQKTIDETIEIRHYQARIVAEVVVAGTQKQAVKKGFRALASYIFGNNIAMTSPVNQTLQQENQWLIQFGMPHYFTLDTLPKPKNPNINLHIISQQKAVAIIFSGVWSDEKFAFHLQKLKNLVEKIDPFLISDHISWGRINKNHLNDLLPLPYNKEALEAICRNISQMQDFLKREILIENPSAYLAFKEQKMDEAEFINAVTKKTGCGLLLDVNNIFVSSQNCAQFDPQSYLKKLDKKIVKEIHLAGHFQSKISDGKKYKKILIDTHNDLVCDEVWEIYKMAAREFGKAPFLIEWDQDFPEFEVLLAEAKKAELILRKIKA